MNHTQSITPTCKNDGRRRKRWSLALLAGFAVVTPGMLGAQEISQSQQASEPQEQPQSQTEDGQKSGGARYDQSEQYGNSGQSRNDSQTAAQRSARDRQMGQANNDRTSRFDRLRDRFSRQTGYDDSPALGVIVGSCPGNAVCVIDTISGSPADDAGIRPGDYILSVNEQQVSSPQKLQEVIQKQNQSGEVKVKVWRRGDEQSVDVTLASYANELPESHRAWLGVLLSPKNGEGDAGEGSTQSQQLVIDRIIPNSPADESQLDEGDILVKVGDKPVKDVETFISCIEQQGPGSQVQLTVERDGQAQQIDVTLGDIKEAPMSFVREAIQNAMEQSSDSQQSFTGLPGYVEESMDDMKRRIRELESTVRELKQNSMPGGQPSAHGDSNFHELKTQETQDTSNQTDPQDVDVDDESQPQESNGQKEDRGDAFLSDPNLPVANWDRDSARHETLIVQRGNIAREWNRNRSNNRDWNNYYRYDNRNFQYNYPYNRMPGYGRSYYRYGGQPYYYGGYGYPYNYGVRPGIQIGRNLGIYW